MGFREWLFKEVGTSTANVATFARVAIPLVRRKFPEKIAVDDWEEDEFFKKKKNAIQKLDN